MFRYLLGFGLLTTSVTKRDVLKTSTKFWLCHSLYFICFESVLLGTSELNNNFIFLIDCVFYQLEVLLTDILKYFHLDFFHIIINTPAYSFSILLSVSFKWIKYRFQPFLNLFVLGMSFVNDIQLSFIYLFKQIWFLMGNILHILLLWLMTLLQLFLHFTLHFTFTLHFLFLFTIPIY